MSGRVKTRAALLAAVGIGAIVAFLLLHEGRPVAPRAKLDSAPAVAQPPVVSTPASPIGRGPGLPSAEQTTNTAAPSNEWSDLAATRRNIADTIRPEREAEIEAIAPRMHLSPQQVETLKRWSNRRQEIEIAIWSPGVDSAEAFKVAIEKQAQANAAQSKAEKKLLGGLDRWNQMNKLIFASKQGYLDRVNDNGDPPSLSNGEKGHEIVTRSKAPAPVDTSAYDQYFTE